jgi:TonB family C-terminal domain
MKTTININSREWCNIIFEGKNQEYGAFAIRTHATEEKFKSLFITLLIAFTIASIPLLKKKPVLPTDDSKSNTPTTLAPPPDVPKDPIKPEPQEVIPRRASMAFTQPVVSDNSETDGPSMAELLNTKRIIGGTTYDGDPNADLTDLMPPDVTGDRKKDTIFKYIEKMPQFPGGDVALAHFLQKNLRYPMVAQANDISGKVYAQFVVDKTGAISDIKIVRGLDESCNEETIRILKLMPKWNPGMQNNKAVAVYFTLPIHFTMSTR